MIRQGDRAQVNYRRSEALTPSLEKNNPMVTG